MTFAQGSQQSAVNLLPGFFSLNVIFIGFLGLVLAMDLYFGIRYNVIHLRGKHVGHMIFIGFIFLGLLLTLSKGSIL